MGRGSLRKRCKKRYRIRENDRRREGERETKI